MSFNITFAFEIKNNGSLLWMDNIDAQSLCECFSSYIHVCPKHDSCQYDQLKILPPTYFLVCFTVYYVKIIFNLDIHNRWGHWYTVCVNIGATYYTTIVLHNVTIVVKRVNCINGQLYIHKGVLLLFLE